MSESGPDQCKADKKREYNRNAQRVFRQRRKEHLSKLEQAHREKQDLQSDEVHRLRRENQALIKENESLRATYNSQGNSPAPSMSPIDERNLAYLPYGSPAVYLDVPGTAPSVSLSSVVPTMAADTNSMVVVVHPNNIHEIRRGLYQRFAPLLDISVMNNPQLHLARLRALAPLLPPALKPTQMQLSASHNPYIDMIPSPSLRDRLISVGMVQANRFLMEACTMVWEVEDIGQMVVWGEDWLNEISWEFSSLILERFSPWLLNSEWGKRANYWRRQRGAPKLPGYD